jgi:hypothetical protein
VLWGTTEVPLEGSTSTHRWVHTDERSPNVANPSLLIRSLLEGLFIAARQGHGEEREKVVLGFVEVVQKLVLFIRELCSAVDCKWMAADERATVQPIWTSQFPGPGPNAAWGAAALCAGVGHGPC